MRWDVIILGSGMAGLSAGLYSGRYQLKTLIVGAFFGGETATAWTIENYPGFKRIDGFELMNNVKEQVESLGVEIKNAGAKSIVKEKDGFTVVLDSDETVSGACLIIATGTTRRKLGLDKEDKFAQGKGIHYCTTCDAPLYKDKVIAIVGGGDSSIKGANLAVQHAKKVYIIVRKDVLRAEPINLERLKPSFVSGVAEILYNSEVIELHGDDRLTGVKLNDGRELKLDGLFIEIGSIPSTKFLTSLGIKLDSGGYVEVDRQMKTNLPGIFAAGDVTEFFGHFKQDITAGAMGSVAATSAFEYIKDLRIKPNN